MRLTQRAHALVAARLSPGDIAIDATAGNGHDTLFLARCVGPDGHVFAFDIQAHALQSTRRRLRDDAPQLIDCVTLLHASHADMPDHVPGLHAGRVRAVMFNLGYLPGSDKETTTRTDDTVRAMHGALALVAPDGVISVLAYRGHPQGREELVGLAALFNATRDRVDWEEHGAAPNPA
ncbi:MAG: class I SAM-dependent methyltransferase, partial [Pseudomonadota bacterium]